MAIWIGGKIGCGFLGVRTEEEVLLMNKNADEGGTKQVCLREGKVMTSELKGELRGQYDTKTKIFQGQANVMS